MARPRLYNTNDELQKKIDDYFNNGVKKRTVIIGKAPNQQKVEIPVPTITGLAIYLGFESRQSFYDYEKEEGFSYTIKRARLFIECEYEEQLQVGNTVGAIFALKNMGWIDKSTIDNINFDVSEIDYSKLSNEALKEIADARLKPE